MPLGYLIRVLYARELSLEDYGVFYGLFGFFAFFAFLRNWGMNGAVNYFANKYLVSKDYGKVKTLFWFNQLFQVCLSVIITMIIWFSKDLIVYYLYPNEENFVSILSIFMFFWIINTVLNTNTIFLTIFQNQKASGFFNTLNLLFVFGVSIVLLWLQKDGFLVPPLAYLSAMIAVIFFSLFYLFFKYKEYLFFPKLYLGWDLFRELINYSNSMVTAGIAGIIFFSTDKLIVQYFEGAEKVAIYVTAVATATLLMSLVTPFFKVLQPVLTKMWHKKQEKELSLLVSSVFNNYLIAILPLVLSFFVFADSFILAVYGEKFIESAILIQIMVFGILVTGANSFAAVVLGGIGQPKILSKTALVSGVLNLTMSVTLIHVWGIKGVAIATLTAYLLNFLLRISYIMKQISVNANYGNNLKVVFSALVFVICMWILKENLAYSYSAIKVINFLLNAFLAFIVSLLLYVLCLRQLNVLTKEKFVYLKSLIRKN